MLASFGGNPSWWDRDFDYTGRPIRTDVRTAAHEVWNYACGRVQALLGDTTDAASMMGENGLPGIAVDGIGSPPFSGNINGLLIAAFCRLLRRYRMKIRRTELVAELYQLSERFPTALCQPVLCEPAKLPVRCGKSRAASQPARSDDFAASQRRIRLEGNRCHFENDRLRGTSGILPQSAPEHGCHAIHQSSLEALSQGCFPTASRKLFLKSRKMTGPPAPWVALS